MSSSDPEYSSRPTRRRDAVRSASLAREFSEKVGGRTHVTLAVFADAGGRRQLDTAPRTGSLEFRSMGWARRGQGIHVPQDSHHTRFRKRVFGSVWGCRTLRGNTHLYLHAISAMGAQHGFPNVLFPSLEFVAVLAMNDNRFHVESRLLVPRCGVSLTNHR